jgi:hypothetical protein
MSAPVTYRLPQSRTLPPSRVKGQFRLALVCVVLLAGCTAFPALNEPLSAADTDQPAPALIPVQSILARVQDPVFQPETQSGLEGRVAALEQRAATLREAGLDPAERDRMQAGVTPLAP